MLPTILQITSLVDDVSKHLVAPEEWSTEMLLHKVLPAGRLVWSPSTTHQQLHLGDQADALLSS